jgi:hypothetical protein
VNMAALKAKDLSYNLCNPTCMNVAAVAECVFCDRSGRVHR